MVLDNVSSPGPAMDQKLWGSWSYRGTRTIDQPRRVRRAILSLPTLSSNEHCHCCMLIRALCELKRPLTLRCLYRYYKVRVSASDSRPIQASLPARCLEKGEKLVAVTSVSGELTALSYDLSQVPYPRLSRAVPICCYS